jgi:hypothetical protein
MLAGHNDQRTGNIEYGVADVQKLLDERSQGLIQPLAHDMEICLHFWMLIGTLKVW